MANVIFSSCCYNLVYSATSFFGVTTVGTVHSVSGQTDMPNGCYTIVSGVTGTSITFEGSGSTVVTGCTSTQCLSCCPQNLCLNIQNSSYSGYSGTYSIKGGYNSRPYWTGGTSSFGYLYFNNKMVFK